MNLRFKAGNIFIVPHEVLKDGVYVDATGVDGCEIIERFDAEAMLSGIPIAEVLEFYTPQDLVNYCGCDEFLEHIAYDDAMFFYGKDKELP